MPNASRSWNLTDLHHVGLTVADIERAVAFYRDVLGMVLIRRREADADYIAKQTGFEAARLAVASFKVSEGSSQSLEIIQYRSHPGEALAAGTNQPGTSHLCIVVDDLVEAYQDLSARGVSFKSDPVDITSGPNEGGRVIYFSDPDGHVLELFQPPGGAWTRLDVE
ncbi:MAG: VOC family protein [Candidatus Latescibacteria bacterium]|nr:VOC family protein [Candidatus Latescibacterota bacterium]